MGDQEILYHWLGNYIAHSPSFMDLQEKLDLAKEEVQQCKLHLKLKTKAVEDACLLASKLNNKAETVESATQKALVKSQDQKNNVSVAIKKRVRRKKRVPRKKESIYQGMFEFHKKDVKQIVWHLIFELKPCIAVTLLPELPAYILFMCIRHTDHTNDDEKLWSLLTATVNTIKKVMKERHDDIDTMILWLTNTVRLLNNLKQYSRDRKFQTVNTRRQNEQCLRNFYLSEYKQVLSNTAVEIYQNSVMSYLFINEGFIEKYGNKKCSGFEKFLVHIEELYKDTKSSNE
ncbi:unconventional myosin-Va-like [Schistocerca americana]|uniref:unconventional myosin-Va-like n=1 Tax=Schistocerca americana TaxID=7009 RepID=UPI001F4FAFB5|nr:unconventional myosin-Va-like [Schistocerca americana]